MQSICINFIIYVIDSTLLFLFLDIEIYFYRQDIIYNSLS